MREKSFPFSLIFIHFFPLFFAFLFLIPSVYSWLNSRSSKHSVFVFSYIRRAWWYETDASEKIFSWIMGKAADEIIKKFYVWKKESRYKLSQNIRYHLCCICKHEFFFKSDSRQPWKFYEGIITVNNAKVCMRNFEFSTIISTIHLSIFFLNSSRLCMTWPKKLMQDLFGSKRQNTFCFYQPASPRNGTRI